LNAVINLHGQGKEFRDILFLEWIWIIIIESDWIVLSSECRVSIGEVIDHFFNFREDLSLIFAITMDNEFQFLLFDHKIYDHVHVEAHIVKIKLVIALQEAIGIFTQESSLERNKN
jgi:hypothetical protein